MNFSSAPPKKKANTKLTILSTQLSSVAESVQRNAEAIQEMEGVSAKVDQLLQMIGTNSTSEEDKNAEKEGQGEMSDDDPIDSILNRAKGTNSN